MKRCPVRKECKCIFECTYNREEGTDFNFTPKCLVKGKKGNTDIKKPLVRTPPKRTTVPKVAQVIGDQPVANIWDNIETK